jgi:hypothetical protein
MKEISLGNGKVAIIDDDDYEKLTKFKWNWTALNNRSGFYARGDVMMHNVIMDTPDGLGVDHINGNGLDNRKENLRICTSSQNHANRRRPQNAIPASSRFRGVHLRKDHKKWSAQITHQNKVYWLGYFDDEEEAARAYDAKAKELFGVYARLNFS